jgi:FkbM family methyltransferase
MTAQHPFVALARKNEDVLEDVMTDVYRVLLGSEKSPYAVVDGGAHQGSHTFEFTKLVGCLQVYAVEANAALASSLLSNCPLLQRKKVEIVAAAIQHDPNVASITFMQSASHPGRSGINSIFKNDPEVSFASVTVPATTIDKITEKRQQPVRFIKLDLEGGEYNAIRGAAAVMTADRPVIVMENSVYSPEYNGYAKSEYFKMFADRGYQPVTFRGHVMDEANMFELWYAWAVPVDKLDNVTRIIDAAVNARLT